MPPLDHPLALPFGAGDTENDSDLKKGVLITLISVTVMT